MRKLLPILLMLAFTVSSCKVANIKKKRSAEIERLRMENDSLKNLMINQVSAEEKQMIRSLTFQDSNAEKAMNFYIEIFENSRVISLQRWGNNGPVDEGLIMQATFELNGNLFMCSDSPPVHDWDFTPAVSHYIECRNEEEIETLFSKLSKDGKVTMPLNNYGFSQKFAWVIDQFGVSWQLNLK